MNAAVKPRVLFVDDEPRVLTTMRMLFRGNYEMFFADSGARALELVKTQPVDVIVSDQRMPGMTGVEFLREARLLNPHAMRILLTGYSDLDSIIGSINEGEIFRFVNKPWANEELTATVARAVTAARGSQSAAEKPGEPVSLADVPGVLVVDDDPSMPDQVQKLLGSDFLVHAASSLDQAVGMLERQKIGVVISDTRVQHSPVIALVSTLKEHYPELVTVILTERADAGTAIDLINKGQIYRFISKPLHGSQCKIAVNSAVRQHQRLAHAPELHQRYQVERAPVANGAPATAAAAAAAAVVDPTPVGLLDRIRSLRSWVARR